MRIALLLVASLACSRLTPAVPPTAISATAAPPISTTNPGYLGQFDCQGLENGLGAYAGRLTIEPGGVATFTDYDAAVHTGAWTYSASRDTFTFTASVLLASAVYLPASDMWVVVLVPKANVVHAENGGMHCQRAVPGQTGPP